MAVAALLVLSNCTMTHANPYYDPDNTHTTPTGFRNNYATERPGNFWKWQWERWRDGLPKEPVGGYRPTVTAPDVAWLKANVTETSITWIGHVTFLYQVGGAKVLTDPHFSERASPFSFAGPKRLVPPALALHDLPHIDAVVISHNHYDHLDRASVVALSKQAGGSPLFLVPLGNKAWFEGEGITNVEELDWWESREVAGLRVTIVPVQHWSSRTPWDRNETLWGGWIIDHPNFRFMFAGDTGYSADFKEIGAKFPGIDLAGIPIGAYEPRWFMKWAHVNPEEAVQIHKDLGARQSVAMHWGTFQLTDETIDEPPKALERALQQADISPERFFVMKFGETRKFPPRTSRAAASR